MKNLFEYSDEQIASVPFKPNITKLANKTGIHRNSLVSYLHYLGKARLIHLLYPAGSSISVLQKPEKLFLNNTNLAWAFDTKSPDIGSLRETFMMSQLQVVHQVRHQKNGDFITDDQFTFEVGGQTKSKKQIIDLKQAFLVLDDLEYRSAKRLPLWIFGFLY